MEHRTSRYSKAKAHRNINIIVEENRQKGLGLKESCDGAATKFIEPTSSSSSTENLNIVPFVSMGARKGLKYREMIMMVLKSNKKLNPEKRGSSYNDIADGMYCEFRIRNDFVIKHVLKWMMCKGMIKKQCSRYVAVKEYSPSKKIVRAKKRRNKSKKKKKGYKKIRSCKNVKRSGKKVRKSIKKVRKNKRRC